MMALAILGVCAGLAVLSIATAIWLSLLLDSP